MNEKKYENGHDIEFNSTYNKNYNYGWNCCRHHMFNK